MTVEVDGTDVVGLENVETPAVETDRPIEVGAPAEVSSEEHQVPAYAPNFKYKVHGQEKEFDDWFKKSIKDQETEKKVRDLYTKADGIDHVKQDREKLASELETFRQEKSTFDESLKQLSHYVQTDDMQSFFDALKIPKEQVLRYALREVQFSDNPQLRQQYEAQRQANLQNYYQQMHGQQTMTQYEQAATNLRQRELDFTLQRPDIASAMESFDSRVGTPGAFVNEIIERGQLHYQTKGIDVPVDQVIQEVIKKYGLSQDPTQNTQVAQPGTNGVVQGSKGKPVIPSIPGSGQSAVKKQIKSIAGLRERHSELSR